LGEGASPLRECSRSLRGDGTRSLRKSLGGGERQRGTQRGAGKGGGRKEKKGADGDRGGQETDEIEDR